ncbi:endonuclease/exonuclease/phosphatase family protein [Solitalea lacus]|uniref:endonuclease/exonuclease/phosphatase family protein n=1 Tax=Solitalea lacus TaxID=2911172 RepID=UPI001EDC6014|nr:endonuclease/exonuclease/phosphatase family protein [Solitalea lacus]UKJ09282.1 endonuclease/exonuclease/phosphatase family protein [Solitalea lacus]
MMKILGKSLLLFGLCLGLIMKQGDSFAVTKSDTLKILTYNVHHCNPPGTNVIDVAAIAKVVKESNASIVALQEVDVNTSRSGKELNEAEAIAKACGMYFCFGKSLDFAGGGYGNAILSKYPISDVQCMLLSKAADPKTEQRSLLTVKLAIGENKFIRFACTHLDVASVANRELQIKEITQMAKSDSLPFFIAGDFNDIPQSAALNLFDKTFIRSCITCEPTAPQDVPNQIIDFIAFDKRFSKNIKVANHVVLDDRYASDHRPVYAELLIKH